jgi:SSS family solute:Na+ symporter
MHWIDWLIVALPLLVVGLICFKTQKHVKAVADFLVGGRVAGRYVLTVATGAAQVGLISIVGFYEVCYVSGYAFSFWAGITGVVMLFVTLTGFLIYRYRETRVMTMAQFFEVRYSKRFRLFSGLLAWATGVFQYGIFPAVGARFLVYYCDLPPDVAFLGFELPTFALCMAIFLSIAFLLVTLGGQLTVMVSDAVLGLFSYPVLMALFFGVILYFDREQFFQAFQTRPAGESFINPFDTGKIRNFNIFYVIVAVIGNVYNRLSWQGEQGYNAAAINAHEQKMAGVLGTWRSAFTMIVISFTAWGVFTLMHHPDYSDQAAAVDLELRAKTLILNHSESLSPEQIETLASRPSPELIGQLQSNLKGRSLESFNTIRTQMLSPVAIRHMLPLGLVGAFCAFMIFLLISTDTTYMHSWGSILVQDVIIPFRDKPLKPQTHLLLLRLSIAFVAVYSFFFSLFFAQITYIAMFFALTGAVYLGGAGSVIIGGLYWKKGTTAGAWTAMLTGMFMSVFAFVGENFWADLLYPWLTGFPAILTFLDDYLRLVSSFLPWVQWRIEPTRFPINGQEIYFTTMLSAIVAYVGVSLATCRESFDLEKMLHRGKYLRVGEKPVERPARTFRGLLMTLLGFDSQYTRGDKMLAWSVFLYTMVFGLGVWTIQVVWNLFLRWPDSWWFSWAWYYNLTVILVIGTITTLWFGIGTTIDLRRLFKRLSALRRDERDDGRVFDHVNADEIDLVKQVEQRDLPDG